MPHHEKSDDIYVAINKDYHNSMYGVRKQINKREVVVGWFSPSSSGKADYVSDNCSLIHEFYSNECANPVHVVIDTKLPTDAEHLNIKAYMSKPLMVGAFALANIFQSLRVTVNMSKENEVLCIYKMIHGQEEKWNNSTTVSTIESAQESFQLATLCLSDTIKKAIAVVENNTDDVKPEVGAAIAEAVAALHSVKKDDFDAIYQNKSDNLLMISYITSLTQTQLTVAEKLNAIL